MCEVGTFKTPPLPSVRANVRFTYTGDSDGTLVVGRPFHNNFEVLDAVQAEEADFFVYLGDLVYSDSQVRTQLLGIPPATTLEEYQDLYKVNREVNALVKLLKSTATYAIWDDHEVRDDYDGQTVQIEFPGLYATGRKAFLEYMPIREFPFPKDPNCAGNPLFRVFHWGKDVDIIILDERSCRSASVEKACFGDFVPTLPPSVRKQLAQQFDIPLPKNPPSGCLDALSNPSRTMLSSIQKLLFKVALLHSRAKFKFAHSIDFSGNSLSPARWS